MDEGVSLGVGVGVKCECVGRQCELTHAAFMSLPSNLDLYDFHNFVIGETVSEESSIHVSCTK